MSICTCPQVHHPGDILDHAGPYKRELEAATRIAREAGAVALRYHGQDIAVEHKAGNEPVTIADRECSELIVRKLRAAFPSDVIVSEELPDDLRRLNAERVWYVDPIDGTKNFIRGETSYSIMIGLALQHRPTLGVLYQPNHGSLIAATLGFGSYCLHKDRLHKLQTSALSLPEEARILTTSSHPPPDRAKIQACLGLSPTERIGSIGMKLSAIALGASDLYVNPATNCSSWDTCAPQVVLEEAGGKLTDMHGQPLRYDSPEGLKHNRGLVASNGHMHDSAIAHLARIFPRRT